MFQCLWDELCACDSDRTESSIKTYCYNVCWMARRIDGFEDGQLPKPEAVIDYMDEHKIPSRRRQSTYTAMKVFHNARNEPEQSAKYGQPLVDVKHAIENAYAKQERNEKQKKNWVEYGCLKKHAKELREGALALDKNRLWTKEDFGKAQLAFILAFHLKNPIRRDLCTVQYGKDVDKTKGNVLMEKARKIIFREHKIKKTTPVFEFILDRNQWRLLQLLRKQHKLRGMTSGTLLLNSYWRPMSRNGFSAWMKRYMGKLEACKGKSVGCLAIRHSVITHHRRHDSKLNERDEFAYRCMHSPQQNEFYRIH